MAAPRAWVISRLVTTEATASKEQLTMNHPDISAALPRGLSGTRTTPRLAAAGTPVVLRDGSVVLISRSAARTRRCWPTASPG